MLNSRFRFHSRGGVNYVYRHGTTIRGHDATLIFCPNTRHYQRFAVVISKKVCKTAVGRNRIRRRFYEALRLYKMQNHYNAKIDHIFIIYNRDFLTRPFSEVQKTVNNLLKRCVEK